MRRIHHVRQKVKCHVRMVPAESEEAKQVEKDHEILVGRVCDYCEKLVTEPGHRLAKCHAYQVALAKGLA